MQFRTKIEIPHSSLSISHQDKIMMFGSCFTENMGIKLQESKFQVLLNPFGILYNPLSISQAIRRLIDNQAFTEDELILQEGIYHSFWHHSSFSSSHKEEALKKMNDAFEEANNYLKHADILLVTFGTAYFYRLKENNMIVGNCHKFPASAFERFRLNVAEIVEDWTSLLERLKGINPKLQLVFTISPIRHLKDGATENQLSKATLLLAIDQLKQNDSQLNYFPSYEIVMDELRDYRFYADDMTHLSNRAVEYIWERFSDTYFSGQTKTILKEWGKIAAAIAHRPFNREGEEYKQFLNLTLHKIALFKEKYPYICFGKEEKLLNNKLLETE